MGLEQRNMELARRDIELAHRNVGLEQRNTELEQRNMELERGDAALYQTDLELEQLNVTSEVKSPRSRRLMLAHRFIGFRILDAPRCANSAKSARTCVKYINPDSSVGLSFTR